MFTTDSFKEVDPTFHLQSASTMVENIAMPCSLENLHENGIIFIKNKKFYDKLSDVSINDHFLSSIGVIFQESFFKIIDAPGLPVFSDRFRFYATVESVDLALSRFSKLFFDEFARKGNDLVDGRKTKTARIHPESRIAENVFLGEGVEIAAHVTIHAGCVVLSNSKIGEGTILYPNVAIYRNVTIGKGCRIHANSTIGSDGFGYNSYQEDHLKVWHFGGVMIEDAVEIGSNTSIDQGTFSPTVIGRGSKIDNQVHIAHNCYLGRGVIICGQVGLAGSVTLGDYVVVGGAANIAPNVNVGNYAQIGGMAGVTGNVPEKAVFGGHPARPVNEWLKASATLRSMALRQKGKSERNS